MLDTTYSAVAAPSEKLPSYIEAKFNEKCGVYFWNNQTKTTSNVPDLPTPLAPGDTNLHFLLQRIFFFVGN